MSLSMIVQRRDAVLASQAPLVDKLQRIDDLVRATAVLALMSNDKTARRIFDELLDLYISLSAGLVGPAGGGSSTVAFVNRQAEVNDRFRHARRSRRRRAASHLQIASSNA